MKLEIIDNETKRRSGNQGWTEPTGPISRKLARRALDLKGLIQRDMAAQSVEMANQLCDMILHDAADVATLETPLAGGVHG